MPSGLITHLAEWKPEETSLLYAAGTNFSSELTGSRVSTLAMFPHKAQRGIHCTHSLHLINLSLGTAGEVGGGNSKVLLGRTRFPNVFVSMQEFLEFVVLSFQRNDLIFI